MTSPRKFYDLPHFDGSRVSVPGHRTASCFQHAQVANMSNSPKGLRSICGTRALFALQPSVNNAAALEFLPWLDAFADLGRSPKETSEQMFGKNNLTPNHCTNRCSPTSQRCCGRAKRPKIWPRKLAARCAPPSFISMGSVAGRPTRSHLSSLKSSNATKCGMYEWWRANRSAA